MGEGDRSSLGELRATISKEIVRLQAGYYGKGPTRAKTYIVEDLVVVVLEESFTRAEKTLAERGEKGCDRAHPPAVPAADGRRFHERRGAGDRPQGPGVSV